MPIYAYRCASCGHAKDVLRKISDPVLTVCPACGEPTFMKQVTAAGFQLKGSGWYVTDFRGDKPAGKGGDSAENGNADNKADSNKADSKADKNGAPKADAPKADAAAPASSGAAKSDAAPSAAPAPAPASSTPSGGKAG
ncbi:MAG: zinc ribbon domain-containing protein [Pseudomonadota bacterium]|nr:zinc ribbon domain-containing protein [Pseudomonadota bacterium]